MTNKYKYFVANWKMFGHIKTVNSINRVIKLSKLRKFNRCKIIYCPPYTLLSNFVKKIQKTKIEVGAQNCHQSKFSGPYTGYINSKMIKNIGCNYVIIGHSENRNNGETDLQINKKIKSSLENNLKILFCIGEKIEEKKTKKTKKILSGQMIKGLKKVKNIKNIIIAYEPVWAIGTGKTPTIGEINSIHLDIRNLLSKKIGKSKSQNISILYGGSVNPSNARDILNLDQVDGALVGGASLKSKDFSKIIDSYS